MLVAVHQVFFNAFQYLDCHFHKKIREDMKDLFDAQFTAEA